VASLTDELAALATLSPAQLRAEWRRVYRSVVPPLTPDLLTRAIAYRLQEKVYGSVPSKTVKAIRLSAEQAMREGRDPVAKVQVKPGARLVRNWQGTTYSVLVTADGYMLGERKFASLSQIARAITGVHRSGPCFFGVKAAKITTGASAQSAARRIQNATTPWGKPNPAAAKAESS